VKQHEADANSELQLLLNCKPMTSLLQRLEFSSFYPRNNDIWVQWTCRCIAYSSASGVGLTKNCGPVGTTRCWNWAP